MQRRVVFPLRGGVDTVTPIRLKGPAKAQDSLNYDPTSEGPKRFRGYTRRSPLLDFIDGELHWRIDFKSGAIKPDLGEMVSPTSGAFGSEGAVVVVSEPVVTSGSWAGSDAVGYFAGVQVRSVKAIGASGVLENLATSTFWDTDSAIETDSDQGSTAFLMSQSPVYGAAVNSVKTGGAVEDVTPETVRTALRNTTPQETGTGSLSFGWAINKSALASEYGDDVYRARPTGNAAWSALGRSTYAAGLPDPAEAGVAFSAGQAADNTDTQPPVGATVKFNSGISTFGTIAWIHTRSGSWADGSAAGYYALYDATSGAFPAQASSVSVEQGADDWTMTTGFATKTKVESFGFVAGRTLYPIEVSGVGLASGVLTGRAIIVADGSSEVYAMIGRETLAFLTSFLSVDIAAEYKGRLFLGSSSGRVIYSVANELANFDGALGAGEIQCAGPITGFLEHSGGLIISTTRQTYYLSGAGTSASPFNLETVFDGKGAVLGGLGELDAPVYWDGERIRIMRPADTPGGFIGNSLSEDCSDLLQAAVGDAACLGVVRDEARGLLRWVFANSVIISLYVAGDRVEIALSKLPLTPLSFVFQDSDGRVFFGGGDNGHLYEMHVDGGFDGEPITANMLVSRLTPNPEGEARLHGLEVEADIEQAISVGVRARVVIDPHAAGADTPAAVNVLPNSDLKLGADRLDYYQFGPDSVTLFEWGISEIGSAYAGATEELRPLYIKRFAGSENTLSRYIICGSTVYPTLNVANAHVFNVGDWVEVSANVGADNCRAGVWLQFRNAADELIENFFSPLVETYQANAPQLNERVWIKAQVPAGTAGVHALMRMALTINVAADASAVFFAPMMCASSSGATMPQPYSPLSGVPIALQARPDAAWAGDDWSLSARPVEDRSALGAMDLSGQGRALDVALTVTEPYSATKDAHTLKSLALYHSPRRRAKRRL